MQHICLSPYPSLPLGGRLELHCGSLTKPVKWRQLICEEYLQFTRECLKKLSQSLSHKFTMIKAWKTKYWVITFTIKWGLSNIHHFETDSNTMLPILTWHELTWNMVWVLRAFIQAALSASVSGCVPVSSLITEMSPCNVLSMSCKPCRVLSGILSRMLKVRNVHQVKAIFEGGLNPG